MALSRRDFLLAMTAATGGTSLSQAAGRTSLLSGSSGEHKAPPEQMSIREVIDTILKDLPTDAIPDTVDTVKAGDPSEIATGIATTFLATARVIEEAAARGANLVITHEPTFYNHYDETDWLKEDPVYHAKAALIERNGIVVWRLHDYVHRAVQDDITIGVLHRLGWESFASSNDNYLCTMPPISLADLAAFLKKRLGSLSVRIVGDPQMTCTQVGVLMGAWGGRRQIEMLSRPDVEVLVCGEVNEWETPEYTRDARALGIEKGLIVVGHAVSEEPGMLWMTEWIRSRVPALEVFHLPAGDPFEPI